MNESFLRHFWISRTVIALYAPLSLAAVPAALLHLEDLPPALALVSVLVTAVAVLLLAALIPIKWQKLDFRLRAVVFIFLVALIGAIRGVALFFFSSFSGIEDSISLQVRILNSTIYTLFWILAITSLVALAREGAFRYEQHFTRRAIEASKEIHAPSEDLAKQIDAMPGIRILQSNLQRILQTLGKSDYGEQELLVAASRIKGEIEGSLRPLSHKIWFSETLSRPRFRGMGLLREALETPRFAPGLTAVIFSLWFAIGGAAILPWGALIFGSAVSAIGILLMSLIAQVFTDGRKFKPILGTLIFACMASLSYLALVAAMELLFSEEFGGNMLARNLIFPIGGLMVLIVMSVFLTMRENFRLLEELVDSAATLTSKKLSSEFASYLHNTLQSELTNLALTLERAAEKTESHDQELRERLDRLSQRSIGSDFTTRSHKPADRLRKVIQAWSGIIDVQFDANKLELVSTGKMSFFAELIEESISNAVRHAEASWIRIDCREIGAGCLVEITNPSPMSSTGAKSLGTTWLQANAQEFSVSEDQAGNRVTQVLL